MKRFQTTSRVLFVALLILAAGVAYAYADATVSTDKENYQAGDVVYIIGTGWSPGETVSLTVLSVMLPDLPITLSATADETGSIQNNDFVVGEEPIASEYLIDAEGQSSGLIGTASFSAVGAETGNQVTVATDEGNYSPGETAVITGSGWMPAESVSLSIYDMESGVTRAVLSAVADGGGSIYNDEFVVGEEDLNKYFRLAAQGQGSGLSAETTFADATIEFAPAVTYTVGDAPWSVAASDLDGDGDNDLAVANSSHNLSILRNNGDGTFVKSTNYSVGTSPISVVASDLDRDGDNDLAVANYGSADVSILRNNGSGTFAKPANYAVGDHPTSVAASDLDGDGDDDLSIATKGANDVSVLLNNGDGTFAPQVNYPLGGAAVSVAVGDFDRDGDNDLAVAGDRVWILKNNGDGTFTRPVYCTVSGESRAVAASDLDGDGDMDLAVAKSSDIVSILLNNGEGTFAPPVNYTVGYSRAIAASDLDGDGDIDLAVANQNGNDASILRNNGDGTFAPPVNYDVGNYPFSIAASDLDGDGDIDLAVANGGAADISVLINITTTDVTPPVPDVDPLPVVMGECSVTITDYPTAMDDVTGTVVGKTKDPLTYKAQGTYTVHWTYTDAAGNNAYQDQDVIVQDLTPPVFPSCAPDVNVDADPGECSAIVSYSYPPVSDNCNATIDATRPPGSTFPVGTTTVTLTATDAGGNTAACSFNVTVAPFPGTTCGGGDVPVAPVDSTTGTSPVTLTFDEVTGAGETSLTITGAGPPPPFGFRLGAPPTYYEIATTATFDGPVEICIDYSGLSFGNESKLRLYHQEGNAWVDRTSSLDTEANVICASVSSFSTFALFESVPPAAVAGSVAADCPESNTLLYGVIVDAYEVDTGTLVGNDVTDENGGYSIDSLEAGYYTVTIVTPLGYTAAADEVPVTVEGVDQTVDLALTCVEITAEPRGIGFWKHQVGVATGGNGNAQVDAATLCEYLDLIEEHFNNNRINPVAVYIPPESGVCADKLGVAKDLLNLNGKQTMTARAKQQLTALLLNVASAKLALPGIVSEDGATVSQAITYCDNLIDDPSGNHETAKDIADCINNATMVAAGMIPLDTDEIAYSPPRPEVPDLPEQYELNQNIPNPFNPVTDIRFDLPEATGVDLVIYDVSGRVVRRLVDEWTSAGRRSVIWDGCNDSGEAVASGVYFYRIQAGQFTATRRMVLLK